jgi:hypothetical protein
VIITRVQAEAFDAGAEAAALAAGRHDIGAIVSFTGLVRADDGLVALTLEHYPAMTARQIAAIAAEACHPPPRPAGARRPDRAGRHRQRESRRGLCGGRVPDGLAEDPRPLLEAGRPR